MTNVDAVNNVTFSTVDTYKIADSQSLTSLDPVTLSSGKITKYNTIGVVPNTMIGLAAETKSMGVLATAGQQEYAGVIKKGKIYGLALKDAGSYTGDMAVGTVVSLYCDGSGNYYFVANTTNPVGVIVDGTIDTASTTNYVVVDFDLTTESIQPEEIGWPLLVPTNKKLQFRDTGIFIQSSANGKLTISSDGTGADDIIFSGNVTMNNDLLVTGTFSGTSEGRTFTGTLQIADNFNLQLEGVSGDDDGLTLNCDAAGDTKMDSTAGYLEFNSKDAVFIFQDSDDGNDSDYLKITVIDAAGVVNFEGEPSGIFRFIDANAGTVSTDNWFQIIATDGGSEVILVAEPNGIFRFQDYTNVGSDDEYLDLTVTDGGTLQKFTATDNFEIETTAGNITLDANGGDIIMTADGNDITMDAALNITITGTAQLELIESGSVKTTTQVAATTGACTVTTAGGNANHYEIATGTAGNITLDSAGTIVFEPTTTAVFTLAATGYISIDAGTTDHTGSDIVLINADVNSADCNAIGIDLDVATALTAGELAKGVYVDANAKAADADTSGVLAFDALMTAVSTGRSDLTGFRILFDGTMDTADAVKGVIVDGSSFTMNDTAGIVHGINIEFASLTDTDYTTDEFNALDITMPATYQGTDAANVIKATGAGMTFRAITGTSTITGLAITGDSADNNSFEGLTISKDQTTVAAVGTSTVSNSALDVSQACSSATSADDAMTVSNTVVSFASTNTTSLAVADVYSNTLLSLAYTASTTGSGTATSTGRALFIDYNLTQTAGTLTVDDFNVVEIDFDISGGNVTWANSTVNMISVNMADAATVPAYGTVALNGLLIDCSSLDVADSDCTLSGINIVMPALYGVATEYGIMVAGDGTTVALCSDGAVGITIAGTVVGGISIGGTLTTGLLIGAASTSAIDITGAQVDIFDFTGVTSTGVVEDSKAYPDKAGSIRIVTPAGATAYINYYDGTAA